MKKGGKYAFNPEAPHADSQSKLCIEFGINAKPADCYSPTNNSPAIPKRDGPMRNKYAKMVAPTLRSDCRQSNILTFNVMQVAKKSMFLGADPKDCQSVLARMSRISCWGEDLELREELISAFSAGLDDASAGNSPGRLLERLIARCKNDDQPLSSWQIENLYTFADRQYVVLQDLLNKFRILDSITVIYPDLIKLANLGPDELECPSPTLNPRKRRFENIKSVLQALRSPEISLITPKQYNLFIELYTHEDLIFLSSWEVYNLTNDTSDFVDNLFALETFEFFANRVKNLDDTDDTDESKNLDDHLKTMYSYKESVPNNVYAVLTKLVKSGDYYLIGQFGNHSQGITGKEAFEAILGDYGQEMTVKYAEIDRQKKLTKKMGENDWRLEGGDRVGDYLWRFGLEGSAVAGVLGKAVEGGDRVLEAVYGVFLGNGDKGDFFES